MRRNQGAILTLVIVALMLVGVVMFVLTEGSNTMLFQADAAYLQAVQRDLIGSGLAWARQKVSGPAEVQSTDPVELDTAAFGLPNARLVVRILEVQSGTAKVHIETSCHRGRQTLRMSRTFSVAGRAPSRVQVRAGAGSPSAGSCLRCASRRSIRWAAPADPAGCKARHGDSPCTDTYSVGTRTASV